MISRRSFIGALAALPVVGKLFAEEPEVKRGRWMHAVPYAVQLNGTGDYVVFDRHLPNDVHVVLIKSGDGKTQMWLNGKRIWRDG